MQKHSDMTVFSRTVCRCKATGAWPVELHKCCDNLYHVDTSSIRNAPNRRILLLKFKKIRVLYLGPSKEGEPPPARIHPSTAFGRATVRGDASPLGGTEASKSVLPNPLSLRDVHPLITLELLLYDLGPN